MASRDLSLASGVKMRGEAERPAWARSDRDEATWQRAMESAPDSFRPALHVLARQFRREATDRCDGTLTRLSDDFAALLQRWP